MHFEDIQDLIAHLEGTCQTIDEACQDLFNEDSSILDDEDWQMINDEIFCCNCCGWWFPSHELHEYQGDSICECCKQDYDDEEDYY